MKKCSKCGIEKDEDNFYKGKQRKDGSYNLRPMCKLCSKLSSYQWQTANKDKVIKSYKASYQKNAESRRCYTNQRRANFTKEEKIRYREQAKEYREKNKDILKQKRQEVYDAEKERIKWKAYYAKYHERELKRKRDYYYSLSKENQKIFSEYTKNWRTKNPDKLRAHRIIANLLETGKISCPKFCETCGKESKLDAHHEDYSLPLEVVWLCRSCHSFKHRKD